MALADTAKLLASLELDPRKFTQGVNTAMGSLGKLEGRFGKIGPLAAQGVNSAVNNIAKIGVVAGGIIGIGVKQGLDSLAQLESASTSVDAAIKQVGLTGQVTANQIAGWASDIEKNVGSAFDDKAILQAATTLIRFGHTTADNLQPALTVMTDLATKTGSVDSAASLLAKALADPEKAAGKLARTGVVLSKEQQAQIKAMVKANDVAGAQKLLLDALAKSTTGAAAASQGPYQRSLATLKDVTEDAERALAEGFLPIIEKVRDILTRELAKPQTLTSIRDFGKGLAAGLDSLVNVATKLPWAQIGDAFKLIGQGSKAALDLFTGLPPWVQTAVLTGWGLNKLTGGALGGIVGELGKGLIKGVLGMTAGVVNINAAVVNGGGGVPGAAAGGGGLLATLGPGLALIGVAGLEVALADAVGKGLRTLVTGSDKPLTQDHVVATLGPVEVGLFRSQVQSIREGNGILQNRLGDIAANTSGSPDERDARHRDALAIAKQLDTSVAAQHVARDDIVQSTHQQAQTIAARIDRERDHLAARLDGEKNAVINQDALTRGAIRDERSAIVTAIRQNRPIVKVDVTVNAATARIIKRYETGGHLGRTGGPTESD